MTKTKINTNFLTQLHYAIFIEVIRSNTDCEDKKKTDILKYDCLQVIPAHESPLQAVIQ